MSDIVVEVPKLPKGKRCGSCQWADNDLGFVALHCELLRSKQIKNKEDFCDGKVRSWEKCNFKPSKWLKSTGTKLVAKREWEEFKEKKKVKS